VSARPRRRLGKNPLLARLRALARPVDRVPPGWRTVESWARAWGLSRPQAFRLIAAGRRTGLMHGKRFRILTGERVYPVPHYSEKR
jgi:hypothetical protein